MLLSGAVVGFRAKITDDAIFRSHPLSMLPPANHAYRTSTPSFSTRMRMLLGMLLSVMIRSTRDREKALEDAPLSHLLESGTRNYPNVAVSPCPSAKRNKKTDLL